MEDSMIKSKISPPSTTALNFGLGFIEQPSLRVKGDVFGVLSYDNQEEVVIDQSNIYTLDGGILAALLFSNHLGQGNNRHINMLSVGTGASGTAQSPDTPDYQQRTLNTPLYKKTFSSVTYRTAEGTLSSVPTNIVDFTTTFEASEAVGALNEMGLLSAVNTNNAPNTFVSNPNNFPNERDETLDVRDYDVLVNYLTFPVINKPNGAVLAITWRLTF
jgi:hypothetical protein